MRNLFVLASLLSVAASAVWGYQEPVCSAPPLTDQQVKNIIDRERSSRRDLPAAYSQARSVIRRQGCYYVFIEYRIPETPEDNHIFKLNQDGVIVDAQPGNPTCPDKSLGENELLQVIKKERVKRPGLPAAFPRSRIRIERQRCLYIVFEYALPEARGNYQVFTIDPFGGLMDSQRSNPY